MSRHTPKALLKTALHRKSRWEPNWPSLRPIFQQGPRQCPVIGSSMSRQGSGRGDHPQADLWDIWDGAWWGRRQVMSQQCPVKALCNFTLLISCKNLCTKLMYSLKISSKINTKSSKILELLSGDKITKNDILNIATYSNYCQANKSNKMTLLVFWKNVQDSLRGDFSDLVIFLNVF